MKIHDPAGQAMQKDYDVTDIERLMGKRDRKNVDDVIEWERRFTGEVQHMIEDFYRARDKARDFPHEPDQLYKKLKSSR
ncbi:hypothetical protein [Micromonospora sp. AMSO31t]|uniref:hypothetical protein n=1 Tax=Micromonospora sp. AMSO31t TaxID=2650566 RepID=UPI00124B3ED4|nr:hypothetical protein [Micromonospora sp. AMSO31t]KAB1916231.1 hypothetical protein F8274_00600 [Micromonospora sp. AMSO31t]